MRIIEYESGQGLEFEFDGLEGWKEFESIVNVLHHKLDCEILEQHEGPYSKYCRMGKDGVLFRLINHPDLGNSLCLIEKDDTNNIFLRDLANQAMKELMKEI
ncbi:MAG: hypothetical protein Q8935_22725 [Bacillota bacterium]|nr:hypothetical protein [Bacillota bacterium]